MRIEKEKLFPCLKQLEVDFVIPKAQGDLPLCIDPFLLYKSRDPELRQWHTRIVRHFSKGMNALSQAAEADAQRILTFPEVPEIGFGYAEDHKGGSGLGTTLRQLLIETLKASPAIVERGIRHVEEMQLISPGIGPDRISDIASNILKEYLIGYTQRQAALHGISLVPNVPIQHIFHSEEADWYDGYFDLPVNDADGRPILLVPRRIVRHLPWINYDNFVRTEFRAFMAARRAGAKKQSVSFTKGFVTSTSRIETAVIDNYVKQREQRAADAMPILPPPPPNEDSTATGQTLLKRLQNTPTGQSSAKDYQLLILDILTFVFSPDLIDGKLEERTIEGTERRDIIFTNDSDTSFLDYVRNTHDALMVMFETKNVDELTMAALNQTATYLGDRIGRFGCIVTRNTATENVVRKQISIFNDSQPRKVLLILSDADLNQLVEIRMRGAAPVAWLQKRYRQFRISVQ
jgi:hypothetical protein